MVLINMLDLKELVSVAQSGTKHKEAETNARLVKCGQLRKRLRRLTYVLDTFGFASLGRRGQRPGR